QRPPARRKAEKIAARGRAVGGAPPGADRRARLDHRHADADRRVRRPLARPCLQFGNLLERPAADARTGARRLVGVEMDERPMSPLSWQAFALIGLAAHLAAGFALGVVYFFALWRSARLIAEGGRAM